MTKFINTGKLVIDVLYNSADNINSIVRQDPDSVGVSTRSHFMEERRPSVTSGRSAAGRARNIASDLVLHGDFII